MPVEIKPLPLVFYQPQVYPFGVKQLVAFDRTAGILETVVVHELYEIRVIYLFAPCALRAYLRFQKFRGILPRPRAGAAVFDLRLFEQQPKVF